MTDITVIQVYLGWIITWKDTLTNKHHSTFCNTFDEVSRMIESNIELQEATA